jgi:isopentenyl phosphate kinase
MQLIIMLLLCVLAVGFPASSREPLSAQIDGAVLKVQLHTVKQASDLKPGSLIYGHVAIDAERKIASVDLNCIALRKGKNLSQRTYVDSIASVSTSEYPSTNGKIRVKVYWYFADVVPSNFNLNESSIQIDHQRDKCVRYE